MLIYKQKLFFLDQEGRSHRRGMQGRLAAEG